MCDAEALCWAVVIWSPLQNSNFFVTNIHFTSHLSLVPFNFEQFQLYFRKNSIFFLSRKQHTKCFFFALQHYWKMQPTHTTSCFLFFFQDQHERKSDCAVRSGMRWIFFKLLAGPVKQPFCRICPPPHIPGSHKKNNAGDRRRLTV